MATTDYSSSNISMPTWTSGDTLTKANLDLLNDSIKATYNNMQNQIGNPSLRTEDSNSIYQDIDSLKDQYNTIDGKLTPLINNFNSNVETAASNYIQGSNGSTTIYNAIKTSLDADYKTTADSAISTSESYTDSKVSVVYSDSKSYTDSQITNVNSSITALNTATSANGTAISTNAGDISDIKTEIEAARGESESLLIELNKRDTDLSASLKSYTDSAASEIMNGKEGSTNPSLISVNTEIEDAKKDIEIYDTTKGDDPLELKTYGSLYETLNAISYSAYNNINTYVPYSLIKLNSAEERESILIGEDRTFYLVPNNSNTGFEKWWYITYDDNGEQKQQWDKFGGSSTLVVSELPSTEEADPEVDYILKVDEAYTYYKYIDNEWRMIAGSMVKVENDKTILVVDALPETQVEGAYYLYKDNDVWKIKKDSDDVEDFTCSSLTDYYFKNTKGVYLHYRYIDDNFELVGADTSELEAKVNTKLDKNFSAGNAGKGLIVATNGEVIASDIVDNTAFHGLYSIKDEGKNYLLYNSNNTEVKVEIPDYSAEKVKDVSSEISDVKKQYVKKAVASTNSEGNNVIDFYADDDNTIKISSVTLTGGGGSGGGGTGITTSVTIENNTYIGESKVTAYSVSYTDDANISFTFRDSYTSSDGDLISGTVKVYINDVLNDTFTANQNDTFTLNMKGKLEYNSANKIKVTIEDDNGAFAGKTWTITTVSISVEASLNEETIYYINNPISIQYTPIGSGFSKVIHFLVDGVEVAKSNEITTSNSQYYQNITIADHGAHSVDIYATTTTSTSTITSDTIHFGIMVVDTTSNIPVINFYDDKPSGQIYTTAKLAYFVYDPSNEYASVEQDIDGTKTSLTVSRTTQYISIYPTAIKDYSITLSTTYDDNGTKKTISKTITFTSTSLSYDIHEAATEKLVFEFNPSGRSNNESRGTNSEWKWDGSKLANTEIPMTISDNFDWINGGFQTDEDEDSIANGSVAFVVKAGTRATINYKVFAQGNSAASDGMNMKFIFKVVNSRKFGAQVLSNIETKTNGEKGCGFYVESNDVVLRKSTDSDTPLHQYICEEKYTELEYNITSSSNGQEMFINLQGIPSKFATYDNNSSFEQVYNPENIVIGSDDCDVWIYKIKLYNVSLSDEDIINNFIADAPNANTMIERYLRNQIVDDQTKEISYEKLSECAPDLRIILLDCPKFTNDKNNKVSGCTVTQIYKNGRDEDNFIANSVTIKGQGTSSNGYGNSARNIDIDIKGGFTYETDVAITDDDGNQLYLNGSTRATKTTTIDGVETSVELEDDNGNPLYTDGTTKATKRDNVTKSKYSMTSDSIAEKYFNIKVNVASSENLNNAMLADLYNTYQPYKRQARIDNEKVRDTMEFHPCALFIRAAAEADANASYSDSKAGEPFVSIDGKYHFYAIGDFGNSKKNVNAQGLDATTNPYECIVELANNDHELNNYKKYTFEEHDWEDRCEGDSKLEEAAALSLRYSAQEKVYDYDEDTNYKLVDGVYKEVSTSESQEGAVSGRTLIVGINNVYREAWQRVLKWVSSTNTETATDEPIDEVTYYKPIAYTGADGNTYYSFTEKTETYTTDSKEYRLAKFRNDFNNYFVSDSLMYHYCFMTYFEMVDNRAKNTFAHTIDATDSNAKWDFVFDYDNDTAMGINNEGKLELDYGVEDGDINELTGQPYYNAQDSVLWTNVKLCFQTEIKSMFNRTGVSDLWLSKTLNNKFDAYQSAKPERLWIADARRKYIRPYEDLSDTTYIEMLNGTKELQRKYFIKYQSTFMSSKYFSSVAEADHFYLRINSCPDGTQTDLKIVITPYCKLYVNARFGDDFAKKCNAGESYTVAINEGIAWDDTANRKTFTDKESYIYNASMIEAVDGIATAYSGEIDFAKGVKLKKLIIGSNIEGYHNDSLKSSVTILFNALKNLEELQIDNCPKLNSAIDVSECTSLKKFSCKNTPISNVLFPNGGALEEIYLHSPSILTLQNLSNLTTFEVEDDYASLERIFFENISFPDVKEIIPKASLLNAVRLIGVDWTGENAITNAFYPSLETIYGLYGIDANGNTQTKSVITGNGELYVGTSWHQRDIDNYKALWPNFDLSTEGDETYKIEQYLVQFYDDDRTTLLWQGYADNGSYVYDNTGEYSEDGNGTYKGVGDPVALGYISAPTKESSAQYNYTFSGWSSEFNSMVNGAAVSVYAEYSTEERYYTVGWYRSLNTPFTRTLEDGTVESSIMENVKYGTAVEFDEDKFGIPTTPYAGSQYSVFSGWDRSTGYITGNTTVYAIWQSASVPTIPSDKDTVDYLSSYSDAQIFAIASTTRYSANQFFTSGDKRLITLGNDFDFTGNVNTTINKSTNGKVEQAEIISVDNPQEFDGTNYIDTGIKLFDGDMPSFTLVIDYKIITPQANNTILSCYDDYSNTTVQGLLLKGGTSEESPTLTWGDKSQSIGDNAYRDIVVMRHVKGDKSLYIYYSNTNRAYFSDSVNSWQLNPESSENYSSNLSLIIGAKKRGNNYVENGKVKVYWCKVWYNDLGEYAATKLASWYREKVTVEYVANQNYYLENDAGNTSKASFMFSNLLAYRTHEMNNSTASSAREWGSTTMKSFLNGKLYDSFPPQWRAMIKSVNTITYTGTSKTAYSSTNSKIYLPTRSNVESITDTTEGQLYDIITNNISRIKIRGYSIPDDYNFYTDSEDPSNQKSYNIKEGDLWLLKGETYNGYGVYLPKTLGTELNLTLSVTAANDENYGWYKSSYWYTRSPYITDYDGESGFWTVNDYGAVYGYTARSTVPGICPCFSI